MIQVAARAGQSTGKGGSPRFAGRRILIIEARFYDAISDELAEGAIAEIEAEGADFTRVSVPGALEIPQVLVAAVAAGRFEGGGGAFDGAVALGCVIRGETAHYDVVVDNANHWLMRVALDNAIPVGNGILTVDTTEQAHARSRGGRQGKGGDAARACFALIEAAQRFQDEAP